MKTKSFSYQRLKARRDKIFFNGLRAYTDAKLSGDTVNDVCNDVAACLPDSVSRSALFESIRVLAGTTLTQQNAKTLAWRLAGNIDKLIDGKPAFPWTQQLEDEIVPVCVEDIKPTHRRKISGYSFKCRALAGSPCPMSFTEFVSAASCRAISRTLGFSAPWGPYPYSTPLQFVNLLFFAHIEAARSRNVPSFMRVTASSSMVAVNREKIEVRCRAKPCPDGFEHPCASCWAGYDQCPYGVHPQTYIVQHCNTCNSDGFFNPGESNIACQQCRQRSDM
jgi:hypothetical protein